MTEKDKKHIIVTIDNPEAKMKLNVKGKNFVDNALKIMKAFDEVCFEIRKKEDEHENRK